MGRKCGLRKINLISLNRREKVETVTSVRTKRLGVSLRIQVKSEVVGQTERYGFKDIIKKIVTTHFKTLGRKNWQDTKEIRIGYHLKILSLDYRKPYYITFSIIDIFVLLFTYANYFYHLLFPGVVLDTGERRMNHLFNE